MTEKRTLKKGKNLFTTLDKYIKLYNKNYIDKEDFVPIVRAMRDYCVKLNKYFKSSDFDMDTLVDFKATAEAVESFMFEQHELNRFYSNKEIWKLCIMYLTMYHEMTIIPPDELDADELANNIHLYLNEAYSRENISNL